MQVVDGGALECLPAAVTVHVGYRGASRKDRSATRRGKAGSCR